MRRPGFLHQPAEQTPGVCRLHIVAQQMGVDVQQRAIAGAVVECGVHALVHALVHAASRRNGSTVPSAKLTDQCECR